MNSKIKLITCPICDTNFTEAICPTCGYDPEAGSHLDDLDIDSDENDDLLSDQFDNIDDYTDIL